MAKKDRDNKGKKRDRKQDEPAASEDSGPVTATIDTGDRATTATAARPADASPAEVRPDAIIDTGRPDRSVIDARLDRLHDFDRVKLEHEIDQYTDGTGALTDLQGKEITRHEGPGVTDMFNRGKEFGIEKEGVDQFLFNRDNDDDAPPTHKPGGNDPSWLSQGWRDTGNQMARDALEKDSPRDAGVSPTPKGGTDNPGSVISGTGTGDGTREALQKQDDAAAAQRILKSAGVWDASKKAQDIERQKAAEEKAAKEAADKAAKEAAEKAAKEAAEKAAKEAAEKAAKEAADKAAADKAAADKAAAEKAAKEKAEKEKEEKDKKYTDPDQDPGGGKSSLPNALKEEPRLLRDPQGAGVAHVVRDGAQEPPTMADLDPLRVPRHETGTPDKDPDYYEVALSMDRPSNQTIAPADYGNPLDANAPPPPAPGTGHGPGGGEADLVSNTVGSEASVQTGVPQAAAGAPGAEAPGAVPPGAGDPGVATIDTGMPPAGVQQSAPAPQVAAGNDFSAPAPDAPTQDPGAVSVGGPPGEDDDNPG